MRIWACILYNQTPFLAPSSPGLTGENVPVAEPLGIRFASSVFLVEYIPMMSLQQFQHSIFGIS